MEAKGVAWGRGIRRGTRFKSHQRAWNPSASGRWEAGDDYRSLKTTLITVIPRIKFFKCLLVSTPVLQGSLKSPSPPLSAGLQPVFSVSQKKQWLKSTQMLRVRLTPRKAAGSKTFPLSREPTESPFFYFCLLDTYRNVFQLKHLDVHQGLPLLFCSPAFHQGTTQTVYLAMTRALLQ